MEDHLAPNSSQWLVARMVMELHLGKARRAMREIEAVEQHVAEATNGMAEMDWKHRNVDQFPFGPMAETKRLAIIITQKEQCADRRLIEALEKQSSRKTRGIILEHERRDFVESWRAFRHFACVVFELLNEQLMPLEDLEAEHCLMLRLEALEQRGITPTSEHYGIEQHFDLDWRRARTYPAMTRLPAVPVNDDGDAVDNRPAWGMSRTRAHMYCHKGKGASSSGRIQSLDIEGLEHKEDAETWIDDGDDNEPDQRKPAASGTMVIAVEVQEEDMDPHPMATSAVAFLRPHTFHPLQLSAAEGTSLENTFICNFKGIRHWLNVTKLYNLMFSVMARWLYGRGDRGVQWHPITTSATSWLRWLARNGADGTPEELKKVARDLKNAT